MSISSSANEKSSRDVVLWNEIDRREQSYEEEYNYAMSSIRVTMSGDICTHFGSVDRVDLDGSDGVPSVCLYSPDPSFRLFLFFRSCIIFFRLDALRSSPQCIPSTVSSLLRPKHSHPYGPIFVSYADHTFVRIRMDSHRIHPLLSDFGVCA